MPPKKLVKAGLAASGKKCLYPTKNWYKQIARNKISRINSVVEYASHIKIAIKDFYKEYIIPNTILNIRTTLFAI